jgi:hypothetical protein
VIVSASRRTDLPALYPQWLAQRVAAGEAEVANPFRPTQVRRVDLRPAPEGALEALVLWTRNPGPLLPWVPEWERRGVRSLWLVTVTGYPGVLEPAAPRLPAVLPALRTLAGMVGAERIAWRYDPVLLARGVGLDAAFHRENFARLAELLAPLVGRCIVSAFDDYPKTRRRLAAAGATPEGRTPTLTLMASLAATAGERGLPLQSCAEPEFPPGVSAGACIDAALLQRLWQLGPPAAPDPGQRRHCRCAAAVDIGVYDTCTHGCLYCYATGSPGQAAARRAAHRPGPSRLA